jgi:RNA polymerase sigma-70 factor (ECF subfamily)
MGIFGRNYGKMTDNELMLGVLKRDPQAFSALYDRYAAGMVNFFYKRLGADEEKAQDFLHDLFCKVLQHPESFIQDKPFRPWLYTLAMNMCRNEYRSLKVREEYRMRAGLTEEGYTDEGFGAIDRKRFGKELAFRLELLPPAHREVFLLRYRDELSIPEIASVLDIPEGTVKSRLFHTLRTLASKLRVFDPLNSS